MEMAMYERMSGGEILALVERFESLRLTLSSSRGSMWVLGPIIQISAWRMFNLRKQLTVSATIARQFIGNDTDCKPLSNRLKDRFAALASCLGRTRISSTTPSWSTALSKVCFGGYPRQCASTSARCGFEVTIGEIGPTPRKHFQNVDLRDNCLRAVALLGIGRATGTVR
jgi:hypothetical protein